MTRKFLDRIVNALIKILGVVFVTAVIAFLIWLDKLRFVL